MSRFYHTCAPGSTGCPPRPRRRLHLRRRPGQDRLRRLLPARRGPAGEDYTYWGILGIMLIIGVGLALTTLVKADRATLAHMEE